MEQYKKIKGGIWHFLLVCASPAAKYNFSAAMKREKLELLFFFSEFPVFHKVDFYVIRKK